MASYSDFIREVFIAAIFVSDVYELYWLVQ
jgi:hypothetical protein